MSRIRDVLSMPLSAYPHVEPELLTLPEHLSAPPVLEGFMFDLKISS